MTFSNGLLHMKAQYWPTNNDFISVLDTVYIMIDSRPNGPRLRATFRWVKSHWLHKYSTRPSVLVQAMSRHTCRTHIELSESKSQQDHLAHIAFSKPVISIVQQGMSFGSCSTSPFPKIPSIKIPYVKSSLVIDEYRYIRENLMDDRDGWQKRD